MMKYSVRIYEKYITEDGEPDGEARRVMYCTNDNLDALTKEEFDEYCTFEVYERLMEFLVVHYGWDDRIEKCSTYAEQCKLGTDYATGNNPTAIVTFDLYAGEYRKGDKPIMTTTLWERDMCAEYVRRHRLGGGFDIDPGDD